jgi:hypothetical protein
MPRKDRFSFMPDERLVQAGRRGAARRWGPARRLHLGDLTPERREIILRMVEAERRAQERESQSATPEAA